ncbi:isocitrate/isopropylmalate family dehydrogenase [Dinghuibacter silviterrae]|uniref:Isocitrate dehydrogenase [NADP] n=1 Tax=Dinghuibacter silviterrae TaxID=1539049 RepID=A0A4R8DNU7_9BACT|nr:isocitrate/isopropylmalate family dehydrogenase [Dinghuibacter silviterrae]TDW99488.1 isocitrate dehydrogenase [Dinghuibacter silviterrae]
MKIAVAKGDGIGPEIMDTVLHIFEAAGVPLTYEFVEMGKWVFDKGFSTGMTPEAQQTIERLGILFKGPMETPKGKGVKSINVTARKVWNTYANKRVFQSLHGVDTVFSKAGIPIRLTILRENIEDTYGGIEHMLTGDVAVSRRMITRPGCMQFLRYCFDMASKQGARRITCAHKANIMKLTDGLFLDCFNEIATEYPHLKADDIIVDDLAMKLVIKPHEFDVICLTNLQGDIVSDLCAGLVGGLGFAPSANIGDAISIFEAVHGTAPDIAGKHIANPTSLLLSGLMMLRHLGIWEQAATIENALLHTLEQGVHTGDFGDKTTAPVMTPEFAAAIISNFGKLPATNAVATQPNHLVDHHPAKPKEYQMLVSENPAPETINGVDLFVESAEQPGVVADKCLRHPGARFTLTTLSNRGTQVWPTGSLFTNCANVYTARFEKKEGPVTVQEVLDLCGRVSADFKICSYELLLQYGNTRGYSLAQGQ